ncbi:MAG TPA: hypothetical protein ENN19_06190 [Chloroflexi bacterium]|nr:hypothetical protein [Chloroflexota bacterium]
MLNQLLELLKTGGTRRVGDLARELNTTPGLVEIMLEDLTHMGYLKQVGGACGGACASCEMAGLCAAGVQGQLWVLAGKKDEKQ